MRIRATCEKITKFLACAEAYQSRIYNKSHRNLDFKVGQKFWLTVKKITIERLSRKLDWQRYGPSRIIKRIGKVAYYLDLPASLQIHNIFYVSLLRDHKPRVGQESPEPPLLKLAIDPKVREYEVEAMLASRIQTNLSNLPVLNTKLQGRDTLSRLGILRWIRRMHANWSTSFIKTILKCLVMSDLISATMYFRCSSVLFYSKVI